MKWKALGFDSWQELVAENAVHSTGIRMIKDNDGNEKAEFFPMKEEYAKIESGRLVFPITGANYRMIVIERGR